MNSSQHTFTRPSKKTHTEDQLVKRVYGMVFDEDDFAEWLFKICLEDLHPFGSKVSERGLSQSEIDKVKTLIDPSPSNSLYNSDPYHPQTVDIIWTDSTYVNISGCIHDSLNLHDYYMDNRIQKYGAEYVFKYRIGRLTETRTMLSSPLKIIAHINDENAFRVMPIEIVSDSSSPNVVVQALSNSTYPVSINFKLFPAGEYDIVVKPSIDVFSEGDLVKVDIHSFEGVPVGVKNITMKRVNVHSFDGLPETVDHISLSLSELNTCDFERVMGRDPRKPRILIQTSFCSPVISDQLIREFTLPTLNDAVLNGYSLFDQVPSIKIKSIKKNDEGTKIWLTSVKV